MLSHVQNVNWNVLMDGVLRFELNGGLSEVSISFTSREPTEVNYSLNLLVIEDIFVIWEPLSKNILG